MVKNSTQPVLLQKLFELLERHRCAFGQERVYWRAVGMVLGGTVQFWATHGNTKLDGVGGNGRGLEWVVSLVQSRALRRAESVEGVF